jgi:hypothetical protein
MKIQTFLNYSLGHNKHANPTRNELTDLSQTSLDLKSDFFTFQV